MIGLERLGFGLEPPRHLVLFTPEALISALRGAGFEKIERMRAAFHARWYFAASYRLAKGQNPLAFNSSRLPLGLRWRAAIADWQAFLQPRLGEELILVARRPLTD